MCLRLYTGTYIKENFGGSRRGFIGYIKLLLCIQFIINANILINTYLLTTINYEKCLGGWVG